MKLSTKMYILCALLNIIGIVLMLACIWSCNLNFFSPSLIFFGSGFVSLIAAFTIDEKEYSKHLSDLQNKSGK